MTRRRYGYNKTNHKYVTSGFWISLSGPTCYDYVSPTPKTLAMHIVVAATTISSCIVQQVSPLVGQTPIDWLLIIKALPKWKGFLCSSRGVDGISVGGMIPRTCWVWIALLVPV